MLAAAMREMATKQFEYALTVLYEPRIHRFAMPIPKQQQGQTLVVVCGWPLSGKSSIARQLAQDLGLHWLDHRRKYSASNFREAPPTPRPIA